MDSLPLIVPSFPSFLFLLDVFIYTVKSFHTFENLFQGWVLFERIFHFVFLADPREMVYEVGQFEICNAWEMSSEELAVIWVEVWDEYAVLSIILIILTIPSSIQKLLKPIQNRKHLFLQIPRIIQLQTLGSPPHHIQGKGQQFLSFTLNTLDSYSMSFIVSN